LLFSHITKLWGRKEEEEEEEEEEEGRRRQLEQCTSSYIHIQERLLRMYV